MAKQPSTEVADLKTTAVSTDYDYGDDTASGFETTKGSDLSIPFINLLQSNSPDVQKCADGTIILGMMKNSVTGEYIKRTGFNFLPVHKEEAWVEWVPRIKGGGFVKLHDPASREVAECVSANGGRMPKKGADGKKIPIYIGQNELVETVYVYGLILDEEGTSTNGFAVVAFTSTKLKIFRDWLTSMYIIKVRPPMYAIPAKISSEIQTNDAGTFANFKISPTKDGNWMAGLLKKGSPLYEEGKAFQEMVLNGMARADFSAQDGGTVPDDNDIEGRPSAGANGNKEEVPF